MKKISILAIISTLLLSTSSVFAQTETKNINTTDAQVEEILAEIKKARQQHSQELSPTEKKIEVTQVEEIIAEIEKAKEQHSQELSSTEKKIEVVQKQEIAPIVEKKEAKKEVIVTKVETNIQEVAPKTEAQTAPITPKKVEVAQEQKAVAPAIDPKKESLEHTITLPSVPEPCEPIQLSVKLVDENGNIIPQNLESVYPKRKKVIFSDRVAPERFRKKKDSTEKEILPGDIKNGRVAAYIQSPLLTVDEVTEKLKAAGFEILSTYKVDKKGTVSSIVFTNDSMKKAASKNMRGFAGNLRVVVDKQNKLVNISNPVYLLKAFMQKEYNPSVAEKVLADIRSQFTDLKNSSEIVKFLTLERYRFMENMPYYHDMKIVKKAKNADLLKKAKKSKKIVYEHHLDNGSIVLGVKLGKRTSKFVKKIGYENAAILPYPVLIENGEAKIMAPQYYIAIMYPMLKMSKFMTIATVPGAITKDIDKIFR